MRALERRVLRLERWPAWRKEPQKLSTREMARRLIFILHQADPLRGQCSAEDRARARRLIDLLRQADPEFARRPQEHLDRKPAK